MYVDENYDVYRLPLGLMDFSNIRKKNKIYVDKTNLIAKIASHDTPIFFSRPRRFGKSLLINTLSSLFANGLDYFHGLDIEKNWFDKTYHVVRLDFSSLASKKPIELKKDLGETIIRKFGMKDIVSQNDANGIRSPDRILSEICDNLKNNSFVLLIDEYDTPLTHHINLLDELNEITSILNDFYAIVKEYTDKFRLIFITGVTRVSHVSIFSTFNNLVDISLDEDYNNLLGFTKADINNYFYPFIYNTTQILNMSEDDVYQRLEQYYDGFQFSIAAKETVYNPWSVLNFFKNPKKGFCNYWFDSGGTPSIIMNYLKINDTSDFLDYTKRDTSIEINKISRKYEITDIPINILLYQAGYLTLRKGCDEDANLVLPNTEVEESLLMLYLEENKLIPSSKLRKKMKNISNYIDTRNLDLIVDIFNSILNECVSSLSTIFNDERSVRDIIYAALIQIHSLCKIKERETVKGKSDLELLTNNTCMIIEFKRTYPNRGSEASLENAVEQIRKNRYGLLFSQTHTLYRVAMVISSEEKMILKDFCKEIF